MSYFLPSSGAPPITPAIVNSGWTRSATGLVRLAGVTSDGTGSVTISDSAQQSVHSVCMGQIIIGPLAAQTISGNITVHATAATQTYVNTFVTAMAAWIATPAAALRATLLAKTSDSNASNYWQPTGYGLYSFTAALSSQTCNAGDYLVLEVGGSDDANVGSFAEQVFLKTGASQTYFDLSNALQFFNPVSPPTIIWLGKPQPKRS